MLNRRSFTLGLTSSAFAGLALSGCAAPGAIQSGQAMRGYGRLQADARGLLDLPPGFSYRIISSLGERMDDGFLVPDNADGMGAFPLDDRRMALVRNHELTPSHSRRGPFPSAAAEKLAAFDRSPDGRPLPGGTTTIIYDYRSGRVEQQFLSLVGTSGKKGQPRSKPRRWLASRQGVHAAPVVAPVQHPRFRSEEPRGLNHRGGGRRSALSAVLTFNFLHSDRHHVMGEPLRPKKRLTA